MLRLSPALVGSTPLTLASSTNLRAIGRGIGQHAALSLAKSGVRFVVCADLNLEAATKTVAQLGPEGEAKGVALHIDVTDEKSVVDTFKLALSSSPNGRIDYYVNAAGVSPPSHSSPWPDITDSRIVRPNANVAHRGHVTGRIPKDERCPQHRDLPLPPRDDPHHAGASPS